MTRPRRHPPGAPTSHSRHPSPRVPPPGARGLARVGSPTGPIRAVGVVVRDFHHHRLIAADSGRRRRNRWHGDRCGHDHRRGRRHLLRFRG
jgi:hypothetical protein